jgi:hypothetical protein
VVVALTVAGCRMQLDVNVAMREDGSGTVEVVVGLDADAIRRIGGDLQRVMEVDDLVAAGWTIDGPTKERDGYTRVGVRHPFDTPAEANELFRQIAGEEGPFQQLHLDRSSSATQTAWDFSGHVDFAGGLEALSDAGVAAQLDGQPLGQSVDELERLLGEPIDQVIRVRVGVRLPGEVSSNGTATSDHGAVWSVQFGDPTVDLRAHGEEQHTSVLVAAGVAVVALLLLIVYALVRLTRRGRNRDQAQEVEP